MKLRHLPHYTYEDYAKWQGDWELIEGIPYAMASPTRSHQRIVFLLQRQIAEELERNSCPCEVVSEVDWIISEDTVLRPDLAVICEEGEEYITETPFLIVEVASKSTKKHDEEVKFDIYQSVGVPYYILVYPEIKGWKAYGKTLEGFLPMEELRLKIKDCQIEIDINRIWR